jgi:hypothetical protein
MIMSVTMSTKHPKLNRPTNVDLVRNPLIGGSRGVSMAQATSDDLEELVGENTIEGDVDNDAGLGGGIDKKARARSRPGHRDHAGKSRRPQLQGKKTHEQQLRMLERKADVPDQRRLEQEAGQLTEGHIARVVNPHARQSEFPVSRGGMNQESKHHKHNRKTQTGHKPPKT